MRLICTDIRAVIEGLNMIAHVTFEAQSDDPANVIAVHDRATIEYVEGPDRPVYVIGLLYDFPEVGWETRLENLPPPMAGTRGFGG